MKKIHTLFTRLKSLSFILVLFVLMLVSGQSWGQFTITGVGSGNTYTQDFDAFRGTAATLPSNWIVTTASYNATIPIITSGAATPTVASASGNNCYAGRASSSSSDYAILQKQATSGSTTFTFSTTNGTGNTLDGFVITWNIEQYNSASRATTVDFKYRINSGSYITTGITGTTLYTATTGSSTTFSVVQTARSISITGLSIAAASTVDFQFIIANGITNGSNAHIGIDDFTMYATAPNSTDATLSALTISSGTLSPTFASATTTYTASVSNATNTITVTPTRNQANATIQARVNSGSYSSVTSGSPSASLALNVGSNAIDVKVTAQDGTTSKTYTIAVSRAAAAPSVTTTAVSLIGTTTATFNGDITSDGGDAITARGFSYNTSIGVLIGNNQTLASGTATGTYSYGINGLAVNTQYFYKAYATNSIGTSLSGTEINFYTLANVPSAPTVINATSSTLDVAVNVNSNPSTTEFAIQETTTSNYVQTDGTLGATAVWQTAAAWGTKTVISLTANTSYTYQVKARNGANTETAFGSTTTVSTLAGTSPALSVGAITAFGSQCINNTYGPNDFAISGANLSAADVSIAALDGFTFALTAGGSYSTTLTITQGGGTLSQTIYVKFSPTAVQPYNGDLVVSGGGASSVNRSVVGTGINTSPNITVAAATAITLTTATISGTITDNGCTSISAYGVEYSTSSGFANGTGTVVSGSNLSAGNFSVDLSSLSNATPYYYHAYATNAGGTSYSSQGSFTTLTPNLSVGSLTAFGSQCINTTYGPNDFTITASNLTTADLSITALSGYSYATAIGGTYSSSLTIAQAGGSYTLTIYVKFSPTAIQSYNGNIVVGGGGAVAVNAAASASGINTSATVTTTSPATSIAASTVTLSGNVSDAGCQVVTARGICYGTSINPDIIGSHTTETGTTGAFSSNVTGLLPNTTYHFRAYATTSVATSYGNDVSFLSGNLTTPTATAATAITATGFTANWNVVSGAESYRLDVSTSASYIVNVISENFGGFINNNGAIDRSTSLNTYLQTSGWSGAAIYEMIGYTKLGASSTQGIITTPAINLSANAGNATLSFDLGKYGTDVGLVQVYHSTDGTNFSQVGGDITPPATLTTQTIAITGGTSISKIRIQAKNTSSNRFYLDNILVQNSAILSSYNNLIVGSTSTSVTTLSPNTTYYYRVRAVGGNSTSANSGTMSVTTSAAMATVSTTSPTTSITTTAAVSGGNVTSDGGGAITVRGICYGTSSDPDIYGNVVTATGTTGTFTSTLSGLIANTTYHVRAYATNSAGTAYGSDVSFVTLPLAEPSNHATAFSATVNSQTQIDLSFSAASSITNAAGYIILQKTGSAPTGIPVDANGYTLTSTIGDASVAAVVTNTATTSASITGLAAGTHYYFAIYPYNWDGVNASTYNYKTSATVPTANATTAFNSVTVTSTTTWNTIGAAAEVDVIVNSGAELSVTTPATCHNLTINSGGMLTLSSTITVGGDITIEDGGSLIDLATLSLTATMKRIVPAYTNAADGWHIIASPVDGLTIASSSFAPVFGTDDMFMYDEMSNFWINYFGTNSSTNYSTFDKGKAYLVAYSTATPTRSFSGVLNNTDISSINITNAANGGFSGWNMIGNPFPSALDWTYSGANGWNKASVDGQLKVWDDIYAHNYIDATSGIIPANQGFFVYTPIGGNINIPAAARVHSSHALYKSSQNNDMMSFTIANNQNDIKDIANIIFNDQATYGYDMSLEGTELKGNALGPQLYSVLSTGKELSTNAIPFPIANTTVNMGFTAGVNALYTIAADHVNILPMCSAVLLEDLQTNTTQDLMQNPIYNFTASTTDNPNRFVLHFNTTAAGIQNNDMGGTQVYSLDGELIVNSTANILAVEVYNEIGQQLGVYKVNGNSFRCKTMSKVQLLRIVMKDRTIVRKIVSL